MASYTITTTPVQEAAVTEARLAFNEAHPDDVVADNAAFLQRRARTELFRPLVEAFVEKRVHKVADAYRAANRAEQVTVETALGI